MSSVVDFPPAAAHLWQGDRERAPLSRSERSAIASVAGSIVVLGTYGTLTGASSTIGYVTSVIVVGVGVALLRRRPLPGGMAVALGVLAAGHLAGGLVSVGGDVLYNAHPRWHALQYDHVFHASASALATVLLWRWVRDELPATRTTIVFAALAALGVGAVNELVEFAATLAHGGSHVGGYINTGWDLVADAIGITVAGGWLWNRGCAS